MSFVIDYDEMILLDAEDLAEGGIKRAYESILPILQPFLSTKPAELEETIDDENESYSVRFGDKELFVYGHGLDDREGRSWGRATHALFTIVNDQLLGTEVRFFAINGGNDLGGMILTPTQAEASRETIVRSTDWPYLPNDDHPWYGQISQ